jgi:light-regulated signal transduction histidine kinase (bacteriophytochrome)
MRTVWVQDLVQEEKCLRAEGAVEAGLRGAFAFPVRFNGLVCGVIECFTKRTEEPDGELIRMLDGVGSQIGQFVERKDAEERLKATSAELARSNTELQQFAYVASHDLTEPLRMVVSYLQLLEEMSGDRLVAEEREFLGYAVDGARRMQALINDLLAYTRVDARGWTKELTNCNTVLEAALVNLKVAIKETGALVEWGQMPTVKADSVQLTQVFQNLIGNAIKFHGDAPPRIKIEANRNNGEWVFRVQDNGIGIDPRNAERIFVVFQRLHTRQEYPGTGMGLAICKKIIERHGGRIWVESQPGQGAAFLFTLPAKV